MEEYWMNDEELIAEVAHEVWQATKQDPKMDGLCHRVHDEDELRRISRAALRASQRIIERRQKP